MSRQHALPIRTPFRLASLLTLVFAALHVLAAGAAPLAPLAPSWRVNSGPQSLLDRARPTVPGEKTRSVMVAPEPGPWDDSHWVSRFGLPIPDRGINALLRYEGRLVAGGWFSRIGELEAPGIAAWDGARWSRLGDFPAHDVKELALHGDGILALATGNAGAGVWKWRGTDWEALPTMPGPHEQPADIAVSGEVIAVSVIGNEVDGWQSRVLLHVGGQWTQLGSPFSATFGGNARLTWYRGELYAAGYSMIAEQPPRVWVMRWTGTSWETVGTGAPGSGWGAVEDLEVYGDELIAAGTFSDEPDWVGARSFASWDGNRWVAIDDGAPRFPNLVRLRTVGNDLYALGNFASDGNSHGIARWDGVRWHVTEDELQTFVCDVTEFDGRLYAGGSLSRDGARAATPLVRREGDRWLPASIPGADMRGLMGSDGPHVTSLLVHEDEVIASGNFDLAGTAGEWRPCRGVVRWDGNEWMPLGWESFTTARPNKITIHDGKLHASGIFTLDWERSSSVVGFENGAWTPIGERGPFWNVYAIQSARGSLFVGGYAQEPFRGVARWDGEVWREVDGGITQGNMVREITAHGDDVIFGGSFAAMGGVACRNIAAWNPTTGWRAMGEGLDGWVMDLISVGIDLYAAGNFRSAGGLRTAGIARWRDGEWHPVSTPDDFWPGGVTSLAWFEGRLVATGLSVPNGIAALDADGRWHPLGSGLNGTGLAIATAGRSLYVGGGFSRAGSEPAYGFAEWRADGPLAPVLSGRLTATPNPSPDAVGLRYELARAAKARLEIFDLAGKLVDPAIEEFQSPGPREWRWTPHAGVRPGVYFARVTADGMSRTARVVRIR